MRRPPSCPMCQHQQVFRIRRRGLIEWLLSIIHVYPFRCRACRARFRHHRRRTPMTTTDAVRSGTPAHTAGLQTTGEGHEDHGPPVEASS
jgi:hypothetical protein